MPVLNERDYKSAKARLAQLRAALSSEAMIDDLTSRLSPEIANARREAFKAETVCLRQDIDQYERLRASGTFFPESTTADLGMLPIIGRIARGLSQRQLADRIGISEQQIQRYESERYSGIGLSRYEALLAALGIALCPKLEEPSGASESEDHAPALNIAEAVLSEIRKRNWVSLPRGIGTAAAAEILTNYVSESARLGRNSSLYRRQIREGTNTDEGALVVWQARVLRQAATQRQGLKARFNIAETGWLQALANLSARPDGPKQAVEYLRTHGIILVFVQPLPQTRLDGAAMLLSDGTPVIALTLRYDRLDSFWFTLFHELGHILLHFHRGLEIGFVDDLDNGGTSDLERQADLFALSAFVPDPIWETAPARFSTSAELVRKLAASLEISPAVVAGRIRKERANYKIFNELIGGGTLRRMLADQLA